MHATSELKFQNTDKQQQTTRRQQLVRAPKRLRHKQTDQRQHQDQARVLIVHRLFAPISVSSLPG